VPPTRTQKVFPLSARLKCDAYEPPQVMHGAWTPPAKPQFCGVPPFRLPSNFVPGTITNK
jgi:hypothetical protein